MDKPKIRTAKGQFAQVPILDRIAKNTRVDEASGCHVWTGARTDKGYGSIWIGNCTGVVHRLVYELTNGPLPTGAVLDHLCRNRACINPSHLEPVTHAVNILRGVAPPAINAKATSCKHGHPFDERNTRFRSNGERRCIACSIAYGRARNARKATERVVTEYLAEQARKDAE